MKHLIIIILALVVFECQAQKKKSKINGQHPEKWQPLLLVDSGSVIGTTISSGPNAFSTTIYQSMTKTDTIPVIMLYAYIQGYSSSTVSEYKDGRLVSKTTTNITEETSGSTQWMRGYALSSFTNGFIKYIDSDKRELDSRIEVFYSKRFSKSIK